MVHEVHAEFALVESIVEMEGLIVRCQILCKHCAQLIYDSNGTKAMVGWPSEGREGICFVCQFASWLVHM